MRTALDCIPCFARQVLEAGRFVTDDASVHEAVLRDVLSLVARMDLSQCPPVVAQHIHRRLKHITGQADPYKSIKCRFSRMALEMAPDLARGIRDSGDPFHEALRLSIAGNVIDLGVSGQLTERDIRGSLAQILDEPFEGDVDDLRRAVNQAQSILFLADNVGEIVFDRLLIQQMPIEKITVAVRGEPILSDATMSDAIEAGLCDLVEVIDNGSDGPGTILDDCSDSFRRRFGQADLIIAKGQGNFETLSDVQANTYFLFKAKCPVIAGHAGLAVGTHAALPGPFQPAWPSPAGA
jgi:hypothetical protein